MSDTTTFGFRMKSYEDKARFEPGRPIIVRVDGKSFHSYTRGFQRPWDPRMVSAMRATTRFLVEQTSARIGYTQSDEITLILHSDDPKSQVFFDGKKQKVISVTASMASVCFNRAIRGLSDEPLPDAYFDSRAYTVPDKGEAVNVLRWREKDAIRNSVLMLAQDQFGHRALHGKSAPAMKEMLAGRGVIWEDAPTAFARGTHYIRREVDRPFTEEDLARIPGEFHPAPGMLVRRNVVEVVESMPEDFTERVALVFGAGGYGTTYESIAIFDLDDGPVEEVAFVEAPEDDTDWSVPQEDRR